MAVDNPPHPAPAVNPKLAALKELAPVISGFGALIAMIIAAIALFASLTIAPIRDEMRLMRAEMQAMRQEMQRGFEAVGRRFETVDAEFDAVDDEFKAVDDEFKAVRQEMQLGFKAVDDEFKAVRKDLADLGERLIRLETLLEQIIGQGRTPAPPDAE